MSETIERIKAELSPLLMDGNIRPGVDDEIARRILAALREPTTEMLRAAWHSASDDDADDHWRAMIDAALASTIVTEGGDALAAPGGPTGRVERGGEAETPGSSPDGLSDDLLSQGERS